jgi:hypothetical protein
LSLTLDLAQVERRLRSGIQLQGTDQQALRDILKNEHSLKTYRAVLLMYKYPAATSVTIKDRHLFERAADHAYSSHTRALALGLLCNWLSLAGEQVGRILTSMSSRTEDDGDFLCIKACSCAALALEQTWGPRLAQALVEVFHDDTRPEGTKETARDALLKVDGLTSREIAAKERVDPRALNERAEAVAARLLAKAASDL